MAWKTETVERKSAEFAEAAKEFRSMKTVDLVNAYIETRRTKEAAEDAMKPLNEKLNVLTAMIAERFDDEDIKNLKMDSGDSVSVGFRNSYRIADKTRFIEWLNQNGMTEELTVSAARVTTLASGWLDENQQLPPGVEQNQPVPKISLRKG